MSTPLSPGLIAIAVHGITLLGDPWLKPGLAGITVPFSMAYQPLFTGLGIIGGYLAALLGLSFYARRRIGARLWRKAHRLTVVVYALAVVHTIGAGTDASTPWMRWWLLATAPPIAVLFVIRLVGARRGAPGAPPAGVRSAGRPIAGGGMMARPRRGDSRRRSGRPAVRGDAAAPRLRAADPDRLRRARAALRSPAALEAGARGLGDAGHRARLSLAGVVRGERGRAAARSRAPRSRPRAKDGDPRGRHRAALRASC